MTESVHCITHNMIWPSLHHHIKQIWIMKVSVVKTSQTRSMLGQVKGRWDRQAGRTVQMHGISDTTTLPEAHHILASMASNCVFIWINRSPDVIDFWLPNLVRFIRPFGSLSRLSAWLEIQWSKNVWTGTSRRLEYIFEPVGKWLHESAVTVLLTCCAWAWSCDVAQCQDAGCVCTMT